MKKESVNLTDVGHVLGRSEMKKIMAGCGIYCHGGDGSGGGSGDSCTNWITCTYGSQVSDACAQFDGSTPSQKCRDIFGQTPTSASWGTNNACNDWC